ncbi:MAG: hypothetical protein J6K82_02515, partial [Alphaproteobacteria bacterium]|nr:hypothetical protein [Alphaproteobacteria bacterium]
MSFERISILATLCVCMCVPNTLYAGQPTVRASIVRPNTNGDQSTSVKQKANQITGGLGTIGGLHTNRVQTGLIPTSSSNKQIANVRDEIQQIKDEFAQELTAYRQEIQELKQELDAKKEQLATLQETLSDYEDMKKTIKDIPETVGREIERRSFITTDAVASEIATAKAAAIKDAKNAALSAVNDMGFAKRVDVTGAINELETQIGNDFVPKNKLNSELGKSDVIKDIQSGIETNANAISSNSEKFETIADDLLSDSEFKGQILDSLDSDIKSLPGAVQEIQNTISAMPRNYVKASELESKVTDITDDKFVKPSDIGGIISDNKLVRQNEMTVAISAVETNVGNTYATKAMVKSTDDKINGLDGKFALKSDFDSLGDTFALRDELKSYVTSSDFDAAAAAFLPKAQFNSTAIANGFIKNDALDDFVPRTEFDNISDTIADSLLADTAFKDTIIGGLGDDVQGLFTTVDGLSSQFAAWKSRFEDEEDGWDRLVETLNGLSGRVDGFEGKFALTSDLDGAVALLDSKISNWNSKFASWENRFNDEETGWDRLRESLYELRGQVSGFGSTYVTISGFNTKANEWALNYDGGRFALSSDLTTLSNQWNTR